MSDVMAGVKRCVSDNMNAMLLEEFKADEVYSALKMMGPPKLLGRIVFHPFWNVVGHDASIFCLEILNKGASLENINKTKIVLIPKTPNPITLKDF